MKFLISLFILFTASLKASAQYYDLYESSVFKAKTVVFVHGGAWISGDKTQYIQLGKAFNRAGLCAAVLNYQLAPAAQHPVPVQDLNEALKKLQEVPSQRCDFKKVYLVGHSAGAHLIAYWAGENTNPIVRGFVGLEGIYDLPLLAKTWPTYQNWFIKSEFGNEKNWKAASPALLSLKNKSPWLLIHSQKDELVDAAQTTEFNKDLEKQKISSQLKVMKDGGHFDIANQLSDNKSFVAKLVIQFIKEH
ncbi:MAG: alpha/beta hydrolase [Pseudobdellovibrio sp.]